MNKVAIMMAEGYEEGETLFIVDILRRCNLICDTFSLKYSFVKGMHGMMVRADKLFSEEIKEYDMIVLPGGRPGGANLAASEDVLNMVRWFDENDKYVAAMCSGTTVLEKAGVIHGRHVTGYVGYAEKLPSGVFEEDVVVVDGKLVTSQGPATVYPFAYKIAEIFGKNAEVQNMKERMMYEFAGGK